MTGCPFLVCSILLSKSELVHESYLLGLGGITEVLVLVTAGELLSGLFLVSPFLGAVCEAFSLA